MHGAEHPERRRLHAKIDQSLARGDLLIVAGAGFGKTELLESWAWHHRGGGAVRWSGDHGLPDNDWSGTVVMDGICACAVPELSDRTRAWRLIVAARQQPELDLSYARLNGWLDVIDADCLRMNHAEIAATLGASCMEHTERIFAMTGGWPLAVQAIAQRIGSARCTERMFDSIVRELAASFFEYCERHALIGVPPRSRELLARLSVACEFDTLLAAALVGDTRHADETVELASRIGLVCRIPTHPRRWRTCHPLLASHLQTCLFERTAGLRARLHGVAARQLARSGEFEAAISHARAAENWELLADLLERAGGWRLAIDCRNRHFHRDWLKNLVESLPDALVERRPRLRLARVMLRFCCGEARLAQRDYEIVSAAAGCEPDDALELERTLVGQLICTLQDSPPPALHKQKLEYTAQRIPMSDRLGLAVIDNALCLAAVQQGDLEEALDVGERACRSYQQLGMDIQVAVVRMVLGRICSSGAQRRAAIQQHSAALCAFEERLGDGSDLVRCAQLMLAQEALAGNRLERARTYLVHCIPWVEAQEPQFFAPAFLTTARLAVLDGQIELAARTILDCVSVARRRGLSRVERWAQLCWLEQLCLLEEGKAAHALAKAADLAAAASDPSDRLLAIDVRLTLAHVAVSVRNVEDALAHIDVVLRYTEAQPATLAKINAWILQAAAMWLAGQVPQAFVAMEQAVLAAAPEDLLRMFLDKGQLIATVLREFAGARAAASRSVNRTVEHFIDRILMHSRRELRTRRAARGSAALSARERQIAECLARGLSNKEIGRSIRMSDNTVKWHLKNLFKRFAVDSREDFLARYHAEQSASTDRSIGSRIFCKQS